LVCGSTGDYINVINRKKNCQLDCADVGLKINAEEAIASNLFVHVCHQNAKKDHNIKTLNKSFENLANLGTIVN
jgi:hypothetical protein